MPWALTAMDEAYRKHHMWVKPKLELLPSEYFRRQGFATFQEDRPGLDLARDHELVDNFLWANDFPHHEGTWPYSAQADRADDGRPRRRRAGQDPRAQPGSRLPLPIPERYLGHADAVATQAVVAAGTLVMTERTLRGKVAVVGVAETEYYKWGRSPDPEFKLAIDAVLKACADAGIDPRDVDGFSSYSNDRSEASRLSAALGCQQLSFASMQWGGGGGGGSGAIANGAAAIATGQAECVVVFRALAQGQFGRFGQGPRMQDGLRRGRPHAAVRPDVGGPDVRHEGQPLHARPRRRSRRRCGPSRWRPTPTPSTTRAPSCTAARSTPTTLRRLALDRRAVPPLRLLPGERRRRRHGARRRRAGRRLPAAAVLRAGRRVGLAAPVGRAGAQHARVRVVELHDRRARACTTWPRLGPSDVDVLQSYENFTGGVLMSIVEHGFCKPDEVNDFLTVDNLLAPSGKLPLNTSGGNLAECYMHGLGLNIEAVRQIRGESTSQVPGADVALVASGPMVTPGQLVASSAARRRCDRLRTCAPASPLPVPMPDGLDAPFWEGLDDDRLLLQRCNACERLAVGTGVVLPPLPLLRPALRGDAAPRA